MAPEQVAGLAERGHEVGGHSATHADLTAIDPGAARAEIETCRRDLAAMTGQPEAALVSFAYPKGRVNPLVRDLVAGVGFTLAATTREAHLPPVPDWLLLPRLVVQARMGMAEWRAKLSPGLALYERLRGRR
jgi:peptidoglycan/xylan/chitin deacetylase (PgdA/CDA1 family)